MALLVVGTIPTAATARAPRGSTSNFKVCPNGAVVQKKKPCPATTPQPPEPTDPPPPPPTEEPEPDPTVPDDPSGEEDSIASNFSTTGHTATFPLPETEAGGVDAPGAFRFICNPSHLNWDDPIVAPGSNGGSNHLHQWFGNTLGDYSSTYSSLRQTGQSTCMGPLNRSAYWVPAMYNGSGQVVKPDYLTVYYKRLPNTHPKCNWNTHAQGMAAECKPLPRGLRYIFGYDMTSHTGVDNYKAWWNCDGVGAVPGHYYSITEVMPNCPVGAKVGMVLVAPDCWDGENFDSSNHRSHMSYGSYGSWGYYRCPNTHPFAIPQFTLGVWYTTDSNKASWYLSSDRAMGMNHTPGTTLHADWFGAWDDDILALWEAFCINGQKSCSGGNLGNGTGLVNMYNFTWTANPRLVTPPEDPTP